MPSLDLKTPEIPFWAAVNATSPWLLIAGKAPKALKSPVESVTEVNSIAYFGSGLGWHRAVAHVRIAIANALLFVGRRLLMIPLLSWFWRIYKMPAGEPAGVKVASF